LPMSGARDDPARRPIRLELPFAPTDALKLLLVVSVVLFSVSVLMNIADALDWENPSLLVERLLNVDREGSVSSWFSACILLLCALFALGARAHSNRGAAWLAMSALLVAMSADEVLAVHEVIGEKVRDALDAGGVLRFGFVIPGAVAVVGVMLLFAPLVRSLPKPIRVAFLLGAALFFTGALGLEALGGLVNDAAGRDSLIYAFVANTEELAEMVGASIVLYALAAHGAASLAEPPDRRRGVT